MVEKYPRPQPVPKGQNLTQRTAEHFRAWGCEAELRAAHPIPQGAGIGGMTSYGTLLSGHNYDWLNRASVRDYYYTDNVRLPQYATEAVLRARVAELRSVEPIYGWEGRALHQDAGGVRVDIAARGGDGLRSLRTDFLVGCDGARSFVREAAGIGVTRSDHDRLMALLVFRSPELHALLERYPGKAFYNVLRPEYEGYWLFFGRVDHGESWFFHAPVPAGTTAENFDFKALLHDAVGEEFALEMTYVGFWDLRVATADSYRAGRVFLAGDAAHSHPPYGGYGINTGLEDARNLGWKLAAALRGWGGAGLLASYDAERRPVFASTARDFIEGVIDEDRAFLEAHRPDDPGFARIWADRNSAATEVAAFEPNYEGSPLIGGPGAPSARGEHSYQARAGHHLAPAALGDGRRVEDVLGPAFTLLSLGGPPDVVAALRHEARAASVPLTIVEAGAAAAGVYHASLILVRPDHFVAWAGNAVEPADLLARARGA